MLASGYAKLDSVTDDALAVSLFGGLGELIYNLSYDSAGNKRTLASLDFGGGDAELDFDIDASAVADAWARLGGDTSKPEMWDIINFAPAYNGIPSDFSPDKALATPADVGLPSSYTDAGGTQFDPDTNTGFSIINLSEQIDEWAAKDLRSYLQRPVVNVWKLLQAMADPDNNGGWTLDLTDINNSTKWPYIGAWLTRPLLPSLGTYKQTSLGASVTMTGLGVTTSTSVGRFDLADVPAGSELSVRMNFYPAFQVTGAGLPSTLASYAHVDASRTASLVLFIQAVAYASDNSVVGYGNVSTLFRDTRASGAALAAYVGFTPDGGAAFNAVQRGDSYTTNGTYYVRDTPVTLSVSGINIDHVIIKQTAYAVAYYDSTLTPSYYYGNGTKPFAYLFPDIDDASSPVIPDGALILDGTGRSSGATSDNLRSGAHVTKQMLLSTEATPADYLLAVCKTFGFMLLTDSAAKKVTILRRKSFYVDETIDLTDRVDKSKGIEITPLSFDAKWYDFKHTAVGGAFEKEYEASEGVQYGIQRVDTGYDFDAEAKDLLNGVVLKSCAASCGSGKYWGYISGSPTPFLNPGGTYTLWDSGGTSTDVAIPQADPAALVDYGTYPYHDLATRAEFRDAKNAPVEGADVLLLYVGDETMAQFALTDDLPAMDTLVGGPCWILDTTGAGLDVPTFTRYTSADGWNADEMLDFGFPRQIDAPEDIFAAATSLYENAWQAFVADRLSVHGKVLRCRVLFHGLQVGPELLRKFYWYRGSLWVLNKISNYSLTTFDPAECEFIQVRDKDAYIDNQY